MKKKNMQILKDNELYPSLLVRTCFDLSLMIDYRNGCGNFSSRKKPKDAVRCEMYWTTDKTVSHNPLNFKLLVEVTKTPFQLFFDRETGGKQIWLAAIWRFKNGEQSLWSPIISFTVPTSRPI